MITRSDSREGRDGADCRIASDFGELFDAFNLVHDAYVRSGLMQPNRYKVRLLPFHLQDSTAILVGSIDEIIVSTVSVVFDSADVGLPMESTYGPEVAERREQGKAVAEVSSLADRRDSGQSRIVFRLMSLVAQLGAHNGVNELLIAVHPRHGRFYESYLGFQYIGGLRAYDSVRGNPAVALALDLDGLETHNRKAYRRLFGKPFSDRALQLFSRPPEVTAMLEFLNQATAPEHATVPTPNHADTVAPRLAVATG